MVRCPVQHHPVPLVPSNSSSSSRGRAAASRVRARAAGAQASASRRRTTSATGGSRAVPRPRAPRPPPPRGPRSPPAASPRSARACLSCARDGGAHPRPTWGINVMPVIFCLSVACTLLHSGICLQFSISLSSDILHEQFVLC